MFVGDKLDANLGIIRLTEIANVVPVKEFDDGEESGFEVVDADKTNLAAVIVKDEDGEESIIIINKEDTAGINLLIDLL